MDGDVELIGGVEKRAIVLVPYRAEWPQAFARERQRLTAALGERAIRIDHIGSTSILGLTANRDIVWFTPPRRTSTSADPAATGTLAHLAPGLVAAQRRRPNGVRGSEAIASEKDWSDMNAYAAAKGPLIEQSTARAELWAEQTGWDAGTTEA